MTQLLYMLQLRPHRAALRLRMSRDSIATIAFESGFGDLSTFNRRFRRRMGSLPAHIGWVSRRQ